MKVNTKEVRLQFAKQFWNTTTGKHFALGQARQKSNVAKRFMIREFQNDPVTKELQGGKTAPHESGLISYGGPRGERENVNLYTFFGFPSGDPTRNLDALLNRHIPITSVGPPINLRYTFKMGVPTELEIEDVTKLAQWGVGNASWAKMLEDGSLNENVRHYAVLFDLDPRLARKYSRTGVALQLKNKVLPNSIEAYPYISKILDMFKNTIGRLFS